MWIRNGAWLLALMFVIGCAVESSPSGGEAEEPDYFEITWETIETKVIAQHDVELPGTCDELTISCLDGEIYVSEGWDYDLRTCHLLRIECSVYEEVPELSQDQDR